MFDGIIVGMYIATIPNRNSPPAILLREGYRENGKVKNRTLANLSMLPPEAIEVLRRALKGEKLVAVDELFEIVEDGSPAHGHAEAVVTAMKRLNFSSLIAARSSRQRSLVVAMVAARILEPQSKLATSRWWCSTTLPDLLGIGSIDEDELYEAMDWLIGRQDNIEKKLASRHLKEGGLALYDLTSSYFEGSRRPLAALGYSRDGKKGKLQVNYGLLTNERGIPVAVSVFKGNSGDPKTLMPQVDKMREQFKIKKFVLVGDRGMITQKQVDSLRKIEDVDWLTALRPGAIRKLVEGGWVQMGLFDERNLFEIEHPNWPGERLIACRNAVLAQRRKSNRTALIDATTAELDKVRRMVERGRLLGEKAIGDQIRGILKKYKVGRHYTITVREDGFDYKIDQEALATTAAKRTERDESLKTKRLKRYQRHIEIIDAKLEKVRTRIERGLLYGKNEIGVRVGKVINKHKMAKHFTLHIEDGAFNFEINQKSVDAEAALDGIYIVRTSVEKSVMDTDQAVRSYKQLSNVEQAFRCLKSVDLMVRPIRHRLEDRVRAHILLAVLSYYVQWHMIEVWRPLLFADEDQQAKALRDPVAPAERSKSALKKIGKKRLDDGSPIHSFRTLLDHLGEIVRNTCRCPNADPEATFHKTTSPNAKQLQALDLLRKITL